MQTPLTAMSLPLKYKAVFFSHKIIIIKFQKTAQQAHQRFKGMIITTVLIESTYNSTCLSYALNIV